MHGDARAENVRSSVGGNIGNMAKLSLYPAKHITLGDKDVVRTKLAPIKRKIDSFIIKSNIQFKNGLII